MKWRTVALGPTVGIIILTISLFGCKKEEVGNESLYFLYRGEKEPKILNFVFKNTEAAYIDTNLMYVGRPFELNIDRESFERFVSSIPDAYLYDSTSDDKGIFVIHYKEQKKYKRYLFKDPVSVNFLISVINDNINDSEAKANSVGLIMAMKSSHMRDNVFQ